MPYRAQRSYFLAKRAVSKAARAEVMSGNSREKEPRAVAKVIIDLVPNVFITPKPDLKPVCVHMCCAFRAPTGWPQACMVAF